MGGHPASAEGTLPHLRRSENEGGRKGRKGNAEKEKDQARRLSRASEHLPMLCPISIPLSRKSFQKSPNSPTGLILAVGEDGERERHRRDWFSLWG